MHQIEDHGLEPDRDHDTEPLRERRLEVSAEERLLDHRGTEDADGGEDDSLSDRVVGQQAQKASEVEVARAHEGKGEQAAAHREAKEAEREVATDVVERPAELAERGLPESEETEVQDDAEVEAAQEDGDERDGLPPLAARDRLQCHPKGRQCRRRSATVLGVSRAVLLASLAFLGIVAGAHPARADAREVSERVVEQWRTAGGHVTTLPSRFLFDDETVVVPVPVVPAPADDATGCTHIALIGARGLSFRAKLSDASSDPLAPEVGARATSLAGVLELRRCGTARPIRNVVVTSDAGRGALEVIVARAPSALPSLTSVIPERTGGALPPVPEAGALPVLPPPEKRAELAEIRAKREGARINARTPLRAGDDGGGEAELALPEGCHRVELFAREPRDARADRSGRRFRLDVDAELRDPANDRVLARDRTEAPDARLEACVGKTTRVNVVFAGAPPNGEITTTLASWPLPQRLPSLWGPVARSKMARVMFARHVAVPVDDPIFLGQGSSGTTPFPVPVETGGCYLALVALTHGHARSLQIRTVIGSRESTDERGAAEEAALSAFCVNAHETARVEVHARGTGVGWGLAVFRVKSSVWEAGR